MVITFSVYCVQIRQDYYTERVHAGPQSKILEGMTWEEAQRIKVSENFPNVRSDKVCQFMVSLTR